MSGLKCEKCNGELKGAREGYYGECTACSSAPKRIADALERLIDAIDRIPVR